MAARACIFGCLGPRLTQSERAFFAEADPWGFILFARNIESADQLRALTTELRDAVGRNAPILIDQEGGRVARLQPPQWRAWPPALDFCNVAGDRAGEAMFLRGRMIAQDLLDIGIDVNCAPMLDLLRDDSHPIIANRCYGQTPARVAELGRALAEGQMAGGVLPIVKHIPGHGRATVDSHEGLPRVDTDKATLMAQDFEPFRLLSDLPMAMTAHVVYSALDAKTCATLSPTVVSMIRNDIGFEGLLMTDDLSMGALTGGFGQRTRASLSAGCDLILHCNGDPAEMDPIAAHTPRLKGRAQERADRALSHRRAPLEFDADEADALLAEILGDTA